MDLLQIFSAKHVEVFYMNNGTVKWFNAEKVLVSSKEKNGGDVFVHFSAIVEDGYKSLEEGQSVESISSKVNGEQAANVVKM